MHEQINRGLAARTVPPVPGASIGRPEIEAIVKALIGERRKRHCYLPAGLFAEPAWDILLVLSLAEARYQRLTVSNVCEHVDVPATTALRWISMLTNAGFIVRRDDANDKRRKYVELSPDGFARMAAYCSAIGGTMPRSG